MIQDHPSRKPSYLLRLVSASLLVFAILANGAARVAASDTQSDNQSQQSDADLRKRAQGFYDLMQQSKYEEGEAFVTPETRANLRKQIKGSFVSYEIASTKIDSSTSPKSATVTTHF